MGTTINSQTINWHNIESEKVLVTLNSARTGLSQAEAQRRLREFGPNELTKKKKISPWALFLEQFKSLLIIILLVAVGLSAVLGEVVDAIVIAAIVIFASVLGFVQEYRAERAMEALQKMAAPTATVLRNGKETEVAARELVPGDILIIRTGDRIPADSRLIEALNLKADEAPLTGESIPVEKTQAPLQGEISVSDRRNMVFAGTATVYGRGVAVITATGMNTEFGKIAGLLQEVKEEQTPLQANLNRMGKWLGIGALGLASILVIIALTREHPFLEMLVWGVSLAVAAVPEALPAIVTISLALGVRRLVQRHALIRKLAAVETLGATTYICSDKTGTLTQDQMTVRRIYTDGKTVEVTGVGYEPKGEFRLNGKVITSNELPALQILLNIGAQCNDTSLFQADGTWEIKGDPTEGALVVLAAKAGVQQNQLNQKYPRVHEIPFSSETKRMTTIHQTPPGKIAYTKGALEVILDSCSRIHRENQERGLTTEEKNQILNVGQAMASDALRVLGTAYKRLDGDSYGAIERDMVFVGAVGMIDPPREEVKQAIRSCEQAGIKSVMITGDHKLTAVAIARDLGLLKEGIALSGDEMDKLNEKEFEALVEKVEVYARVSPTHKLRVVEALTKRGHVVAMTGDGINDAPALKKADIGVAMGITGTDVTKEVADMILTDDNFASIVAAVEEGRNIFNNIKNFLVYLLSSNLGEIFLMASAILFAPLLGLPSETIPLVAVQILYVNLATDGFPAIALSVNPPDPDIMKQKPRPRQQSVFTGPVLAFLLGGGIWTGLVTLGIMVWSTNSGRSAPEVQSMTFVTLILVQFFNAFNCRSLDRSLFKIGITTNKWLLIAIAWESILLALLVYVPVLQEPFHTYALTAEDWIIVVSASSSILVAGEVYKFMRSRLRSAGRW